MFKNKKINDEYATRYIASWIRVGGQLYYGEDVDKFQNWLISMGLSDDDVCYITELARCGKLELEASARKFLKEYGAEK